MPLEPDQRNIRTRKRPLPPPVFLQHPLLTMLNIVPAGKREIFIELSSGIVKQEEAKGGSGAELIGNWHKGQSGNRSVHTKFETQIQINPTAG